MCYTEYMKKLLIVVLLLLIAGGVGVGIYLKKEADRLKMTETFYLAADHPQVTVMDEEKNPVILTRGSEVEVRINKELTFDDVPVTEFLIGEELYYTPDKELFVKERKDCVRETRFYTCYPEVLYEEPQTSLIVSSLPAMEEVHVSGYRELREDGTVDWYLLDSAYGQGWIKGDEYHLQEEKKNLGYDGSVYESVSQNGGAASGIFYYKKNGPIEGNVMPEKVNALYINADNIRNAEEYLDVAAGTQINAFVVDIKDTHILSYSSPVVEEYAPSSYPCVNDLDLCKQKIKALKDAGYYLIGRITVFKDPAFAADHPDTVIMHQGDFYRYNGSYWPSIFSRDVWEYNVSLGREAVEMFGFNEIQFDYVRSPEFVPVDADLHNEYGESRVQAITNFVRYASDVLHEAGAYVSIDVFGETSGNFATAYGQYWPAISNAADAVSSMPYPDHFGAYSFGIPEPWKDPYALMYNWGLATKACQDVTYEPAKVRTWIQVYDSIVDGTIYDASMVKAEINGLSDAGVNDGYITWNGAASLGRFRNVRSAFE